MFATSRPEKKRLALPGRFQQRHGRFSSVMLVWKKLASAKWEDAWVERLAFLGPMRLVISSLPNRKSLRLEAYGLTRKEGDDLVERFGGQVREISDKFIAETPEREPIAIRDRFLIVDREPEDRAALETGGRQLLLVPAAMAFGTGDHATTASCLRLLCDLAPKEGRWSFLDLGTGSGILAIAARKLGAKPVEGCDFDPHAVRTAKENIALNGAAPLPVYQRDVLCWQPKKQWDFVAANLFSEVLIAAAPTILAALRPGGVLILSGILRTQEGDVVQAFRALGITFEKTVRKGKWVTLAGRSQG